MPDEVKTNDAKPKAAPKKRKATTNDTKRPRNDSEPHRAPPLKMFIGDAFGTEESGNAGFGWCFAVDLNAARALLDKNCVKNFGRPMTPAEGAGVFENTDYSPDTISCGLLEFC